MKNNIPLIVTIVLVVAIIGGIIFYSSEKANRPGEYDTFAVCIADSGAKFYGAYWCSHCQNQKALFGNSAKKLPYIECSLPNGNGQTKVCVDNGIESYPTWVFADGTRQTGELSLSELASSTKCALVKDSI